MERLTVLASKLQASIYSYPASQTVSCLNDKVVCLTKDGLFSMHHLHWLESLGNVEQTVKQGDFTRVLS